MKNPVFTGAGVAIITPMYEDGSINFDELGRIVEDQIARGTDAIVICGTTGECSTMTDEEQLAAIKYTVDLVNHRVPVIAGAGSGKTRVLTYKIAYLFQRHRPRLCSGCKVCRLRRRRAAAGDPLLQQDLSGWPCRPLHRNGRGRRHSGHPV